jgi:hypothetical protein
MTDTATSQRDTTGPGHVSVPRRAHGPRPEYLGNVHLDNMLSTLMALAQEVWLSHERIALLEAKVAGMSGAADADVPLRLSAEVRAGLDEFLGRLLRATSDSASRPVDTDQYEAIVRSMGGADV